MTAVPRPGPRARLAAAALCTVLLAATVTSCSVTGTGPDPGDAGRPTPSTTGDDHGGSSGGGSGGGSGETGGGAGETAPVDWEPCDGGDCAELSVPLDHDDPDGRQITIALLRTSEADPDERIGSLLLNPGGPGGSGIDFVRRLPVPHEVAERFDIVGFDPRGVGRSTPIDCHSHLVDLYDADPTMEDQTDRDRYLAVSQRFVDECEARHGDLLPHLGTEDVARDLDRIRAALGDDGLTYLGYSYGTSIGQQYARLFPTKVRALVLDGVVDPSVSGLEAASRQADGFEAALGRFIADCDERACLDGGAGATVDAVIAAAERAPIPAPGADRPATPGVVGIGIGQALYARWLWPTLADALADARDGDGTGLVALADQYLGREGDDHALGFEVYFAVSCLDSTWPTDPDDVFDAAEEVGRRDPRTGEGLVNDYVRCALWPVDPQPLEPVPSDLHDLPPVLLVSTTGDPATPHGNAQRVARTMPNAVLLTHRGDGHTITFNGSACVDEVVVDYLVTAEAPAADPTC